MTRCATSLRWVSATAGTRSRQLGLAHSQRRSEPTPMRSRFHARRVSLSASGLDRLHSRVARFGLAGRDRDTLGAPRDATLVLGTATSSTSTMTPPVIERLDGAGRTCSSPRACGRTFRRITWHGAPRTLCGAKSLWLRAPRSYHSLCEIRAPSALRAGPRQLRRAQNARIYLPAPH